MNSLEEILSFAKKYGSKGSWKSYEIFKNKIGNLGLSSKEYESAIKQLCDILEV